MLKNPSIFIIGQNEWEKRINFVKEELQFDDK